MSIVAVRQTLSSIGKRRLVDVEIRRVQHEAAARLDRTAHQHLHPADLLRQTDALRFRHDVELDEEIREVQVGGRPVEDDAHGALGGMRADVDHGTRETVVGHAGHCDEKLAVEISRFLFVL